MKNIVLICNNSNTVINFRKEFILFLKTKNFDVTIIAGDNQRADEIRNLGTEFICIPFSNRSKSIRNSLYAIKSIKKALKRINPDIVFTFQIKPNIFGGIVGRKLKINNLFCMIEGLGDPFQPKNLRDKIFQFFISKVYKYSLKKAKNVFVLNNDDKSFLIKKRIIKEKQAVLINGIGIDTSAFIPSNEIPHEKKVVNLSRLIVNKGIFEYCEIARQTRKIRPDIVFELYGEEEQLLKKDLESYLIDNSIIYKGYTTNPKEIFESSRIVVSTSYREGLPRVLMEAMALAKPIIASDVIGTRSLVRDGVNGYLIKKDDISGFVEKIIKLIDDTDLLKEFGQNGRKVCQQKFDCKVIHDQIFEIIIK